MPSVVTTERTARSVADAVRRRVERSDQRFWRVDDFDLPRAAASRELSRLVDAGKLRHVRRGLYWRGQQTLLGMSGPSPDKLVMALVGRDGVGPAEWSAALALGLTTQHPRNSIIAVPTRPPAVEGRIELKDRRGREGRAANKLNWYEVAILEVLGDWSRLVELPREEAVDRLGEWLSSDKVRPAKLARAAKSEPAVVRAGLRGLLHRNGLKAEAERIPPAHTQSVNEHALIAA
jgi:hypothetical protein